MILNFIYYSFVIKKNLQFFPQFSKESIIIHITVYVLKMNIIQVLYIIKLIMYNKFD
jgi:hypothetical protein